MLEVFHGLEPSEYVHLGSVESFENDNDANKIGLSNDPLDLLQKIKSRI
jgi:hypothetical protein